VSFFDLFSLPDIVAKSKSIADVALLVHKSLVYTLIALIVLHLSASLYHHFGLKDKTLKRMWFSKLDD
jgi:cytochrome b561